MTGLGEEVCQRGCELSDGVTRAGTRREVSRSFCLLCLFLNAELCGYFSRGSEMRSGEEEEEEERLW